MTRITTEDELRTIFRSPTQMVLDKEIDHLDDACRRFIAASTFFALGSRHADGTADVSPKGGPAGFVEIVDDHHLAYGELPGNNRLDSFTNLLADPAVGLMFMIAGLGETLRVNGTAELRTDDALIERCTIDGRRPKLVVVVEVRKAFIHCAKALRRSDLWKPDTWMTEQARPRPAQILREHSGLAETEIDADMIEAALEDDYQNNIWN